MTDTNSSFASAFRQHVVPDLERAIAHLAADLADDRLTFPQAMARLMGSAHRRGAGYLPDALYDDLREWVSVTLLDESVLVTDARALIERLLREPSRGILRQAVRAFLSDNAMEFGNE